MIELQQPRRRSQPSLPSLSRQSFEVLPAEAPTSPLGWSPADELAALETVWESLCQDAASPATAPQLLTFTSAPVARASAQRPVRQRQRYRLAKAPGCLAS